MAQGGSQTRSQTSSMSQPSFLSRKTFGISNYLLIAIVVVGCAAMVPNAAFWAIKSNTNRSEDWLPASYTESADLDWFRGVFASDSFILCTWNDCTLGNDEQLSLLVDKLEKHVVSDEIEEPSQAWSNDDTRGKGRWFRRLISGPSMIEELQSPPLSLSYSQAVHRLEGALVGPAGIDAEGNPLPESGRLTCLAIYLALKHTRDNIELRDICAEIERLAVEECGVPKENFRLCGPAVDNVTIDATSKSSFSRCSALNGIVGLVLAFWCFRSISLTGIVVFCGALSANVSLAIVAYYGAAEIFFGGFPTTKYGQMDAVMMTMPAVVYVLGISGAVHIINYYLDARRVYGVKGAAEAAARVGWVPCSLAALTTAVGLGSLAASDIVPIKKFGGFTAVAVLTTLAVLFTVLPVFLHRFPPKLRKRVGESHDLDGYLPLIRTFRNLAQAVIKRHAFVSVFGLIAMVVVGLGLLKMESSVRVLKLLHPKSDLISDYRWVEQNLGNIVPMEVVISIPDEKCRSRDEHAEFDGAQYRLSMVERLALIRRLVERVEGLDDVSRALSPATFAPDPAGGREAYAVNKALQDNRDALNEYLKDDVVDPDGEVDSRSRQLWRITARVSATDDVDYGQFVSELKQRIEPVLAAYRQRDELVTALHAQGQKLEGSKICVLFDEPGEATAPEEGTSANVISELLLKESGVRNRVDGERGELTIYNLASFASKNTTELQREKIIDHLKTRDAVVLVEHTQSVVPAVLAKHGTETIDLFRPELTQPQNELVATSSNPIDAVYTGIIPLVFKTQRQLLVSLQESMFWAVVAIAIVMAIVLRSPVAGLLSMIPNVFPVLTVFGLLGWLGIKVDIGIMMTASVALGVAVDDTVHFLTWFRRGTLEGYNRRRATMLAYERCAAAMTQTTMIAGLGLAVFMASSFTPTRQFGIMMITMLAAALVGDLLLLPALVSGPLGRFFCATRRSSGKAASRTLRQKDSSNERVATDSSVESEIKPKQDLVDLEGTPSETAYARGPSPVENGSPQSHAGSAEEVLETQLADATTASSQSSPVRRLDESELSSAAHKDLRNKLRGFRRDTNAQT